MPTDKHPLPTATDPAAIISVTVLLFGPLAQAAGMRSLRLDLPAGTTVQQALTHLSATHPAIISWLDRLATAVNMGYVSGNFYLSDGDELALFPPVSGG